MSVNNDDLKVRILTEYVSQGVKEAESDFNRLKVMLNTVSKVSKDFSRGYQEMGDQVLNSQKSMNDFGKSQGVFYTDINKKVSAFGNELSNVGSTSTMVSKEFQGAFKDIGSQVMGAQKQQGSYWDSYMKNNKHATRLTDQFSGRVRNMGDVNAEATKKMARPFAGYAMSIMFAGMALQRFASQVYKFGTKAFQEISHSIEGNVTNVDKLEGSMKYLGFTIGQALEPTLGWLIGIVDKLSDWSEENPELVKGITEFGVVAGGLFAVGGMGALAINGFADLYTKIQNSNTAMGDFLKKTTGMQQLSVGFGLVYAGKGIKDLLEGEILSGVAELTKSAGFFAFAGGKSGTAAALFAIGAAIEIVDIMTKEGKLSPKSFGKFLMNNSAGAFIYNPAIGLAVLTVGVMFTWANPDWLDKFLINLGLGFAALLSLVTAIIDLALSPIVAVINGVIAAAKSIGLMKNTNYVDFLVTSRGVQERIQELKEMKNLLNGDFGGSLDTVKANQNMNSSNQNMSPVVNNYYNISDSVFGTDTMFYDAIRRQVG